MVKKKRINVPTNPRRNEKKLPLPSVQIALKPNWNMTIEKLLYTRAPVQRDSKTYLFNPESFWRVMIQLMRYFRVIRNSDASELPWG